MIRVNQEKKKFCMLLAIHLHGLNKSFLANGFSYGQLGQSSKKFLKFFLNWLNITHAIHSS